MGVRIRKKPSPTQPQVRKPKIDMGGAAGAAREGCPDAVAVEGVSEAVSVGQRASLTLADGRPQLVVENRVVAVSAIRPDRAVVTRCLEEGESYLGRVTRVSAGRFEVELGRESG